MSEDLHPSYGRLMAALKQHGMTRKEFDAAMRLESAVVSNWRKRGVPANKAAAAARAAHTSSEWILEGKPPDESHLTDEEKRLIRRYRQMDKRQRDSLHYYAYFLVFMTSSKSEREQLARDAVLDTTAKRE